MEFILNGEKIDPPKTEDVKMEVSYEKQTEIHNQEYMLYNHHLNLGRWLN